MRSDFVNYSCLTKIITTNLDNYNMNIVNFHTCCHKVGCAPPFTNPRSAPIVTLVRILLLVYKTTPKEIIVSHPLPAPPLTTTQLSLLRHYFYNYSKVFQLFIVVNGNGPMSSIQKAGNEDRKLLSHWGWPTMQVVDVTFGPTGPFSSYYLHVKHHDHCNIWELHACTKVAQLTVK